MKKHISDLVLYNGDDNFEKGVAVAYLHYKAGILSESPDEPVVIQRIEEEPGKYLVIDGYHRIMEGLMRGERSFNCRFYTKNMIGGCRLEKIDSNYQKKNKIPTAAEKLKK